ERQPHSSDTLQYEPRLLVVDPVIQTAEQVGRYLRTHGFACKVRGASTVADFRSALREFRPHVILAASRSAQGLDGTSALEIARSEAPDAAFLFWGELQDQELATEVLQMGAADFLPKNEPARLVPAVYRALRDVAARRTRRLAEQRIRESEQRLRDIIDTAQDWIWELDPGGRFVFSSESVQQMLGTTAQELLGQDFRELIHPEDLQRFEGALTALGPKARTGSGIVTRWRSRSGEYRWLEANVLALSIATGMVTGFRGTLRDVTERRRAEEHVERLTRMLQMQSGINAAIVRTRDHAELLREASRLAMEVCRYDHVLVVLRDRDTGIGKPIFWAGLGLEYRGPADFPVGDGSEPDASLAGRALRTGEIVVCNDLRLTEPKVALREELLALGIRSIVSLPLKLGGSTIGALNLASREVDAVRDDELRLLQEVASSLSFALQSRQNEAAAQFLAAYDPLTGLAKRALLCDRIDALLAAPGVRESRPAVVVFDLDRLSSVNDTFGRHVGDLLLQQAADRLKHGVDDHERVGYLGGGTFALVLPQLETSEANVAALLESTVFKNPFVIEGHEIRAGFKSGITRYPSEGRDGNTLLQQAEAALKVAKDAGEPYLHYQLKMHSEMAQRIALEHRLRAAIDEERFVLHYQPQVSVATGRIEAVEALLRWNHPEWGLVAPDRFLPVLESSGLIVAVGEWVLRQAATDCLRWQSSALGPVRVAVNVSALQIRRRGFVQQVLAAAAGWPLRGYGIDIEITETGLLQDLESTTRKLRELREAGVRIAIDDFGTGYSSLGLLSRLPVDVLKIDRMFINGLPDDRASRTLVSSIISLAFAFDLVAVAEGVETPAQLAALRAMNCPQSQGYLHARPMPAAALEELLAGEPPRAD
ncbi:MAG TPA: EAL domain-containing protein, partial [Steroidobacteraceae bacterium]|nr:EAL domain-containing protein [Steroidobacteraceae bacterium]